MLIALGIAIIILAGIAYLSLLNASDPVIKPQGVPRDPNKTLSPDEEISELLASGNKIAAIKRYREVHGVGLAEAKQAIDALS